MNERNPSTEDSHIINIIFFLVVIGITLAVGYYVYNTFKTPSSTSNITITVPPIPAPEPAPK